MQNFELYNKILKEVEEDRVSMSIDGEYAIFKYKDKCQFDKLWNDVNKMCRGMVWHIPTKTLCALPFNKFWNLNEFDDLKFENLPIDKPYFIWEKLDGSMISVFADINGNIKCATTGSLISEQSKWAYEWLINHFKYGPLLKNKFIDYLQEGNTFIFEAIYPENLIVVNYGNRQDLVLLAIRNSNGKELHPNIVGELAQTFGFNIPKKYSLFANYSFQELGNGKLIRIYNSQPFDFEPNTEGYVLHWPHNNLRVKIKSEEYVQLHRLRSTFSLKGIGEALTEGNYGKLYSVLPSHLRSIADDLAAGLRTRFFELKANLIDAFNTIKDFTTRKEQALYILKHYKDISSLLFLMLDNKCSDREIWLYIYKTL